MCAKITMSKESLAPKPALPDGLYDLRLEGFEPEFSKNKNSVNLNPILKVVNHPTLTGQRIYDNLNSSAPWILESFSHAFGVPLVDDGNGDMSLPGEFLGPDDSPDKWNYVGPLSGMVAKAFAKQTVYNNNTTTKIDQWVCNVPQCSTKHAQGLAK